MITFLLDQITMCSLEVQVMRFLIVTRGKTEF